MNLFLVTVRALLADPDINEQVLAIQTGMSIATAYKHLKAARVMIAEIRGAPIPTGPPVHVRIPTFPRLKKNPLQP